jgi:hypothetical protein
VSKRFDKVALAQGVDVGLLPMLAPCSRAVNGELAKRFDIW